MSISPPGKDTAPKSSLLEAVKEKFGGIEECRSALIKEGSKLFGSGYVWLVQENESLSVVLIKDAMNPLVEDLRPLLCLDLWEHAYYLDYEGDRMSYLDSGVKELLNWGFADRNWEGNEEW
jgi:Fe-Mn family superoxide dismutase